MFRTILVTILMTAGMLCAQNDLLKQAKATFKPIPATPPALTGNPANPAKVELGKMLYFDPRLSSSGFLSCNSCHSVGLAGVDMLQTAIGNGWQHGPRNSPTVFNAVFNATQFWDGRAKDLFEQAKGPLQAPPEMASNPERVEATIKSMPGYVEQFQRAFPGDKNPITFDNVAKAIAVFEATLITPGSKFDQFLMGKANALNATEKDGLRLFMSKGCSGCHNGVNLGGTNFFRFGMKEKPAADLLPASDKGRYDVTKATKDEYAFKTPTLRNIALTPPYFHTGRVWDLKDAVQVMAKAQLGAPLEDKDAAAVAAFLVTLTGKQPIVTHPILPQQTDDTPKPLITAAAGTH